MPTDESTLGAESQRLLRAVRSPGDRGLPVDAVSNRIADVQSIAVDAIDAFRNRRNDR
ncbi:hypothetical protein [Halorubrum sp. FL23]|uniref:hypothetical protein n=1 Tax=Halorubrum sp. FL23 TaxID=3458704 RepID=UPI00403379CC